MPESPARSPLAEDTAPDGVALLITDMLSRWEFPDGAVLRDAAAAIVQRIAALKARCVAAGVPVVYVNDNEGRWRSDYRHVFERAVAPDSAGAAIARALAPAPDDYVVLKPKHSGFHATPLDLLLRHLRASRLVITGVTSDQCVLNSAADARIRDHEVIVPHDASATLSAERHARVLHHLEDALGVGTTHSADIELPRTTTRPGR